MKKLAIILLALTSLVFIFGCTQNNASGSDNLTVDTSKYVIENSTSQNVILSDFFPDKLDPAYLKTLALFNHDSSICDYISTSEGASLKQKYLNTSCKETLSSGTLIFKDITAENPVVGLSEKCKTNCMNNQMQYLADENLANPQSAGFFSIHGTNKELVFFSYCYCFAK